MNKIMLIMLIIMTSGLCSFAQSIKGTPSYKIISFEDVKNNDGSIPEKDFFMKKKLL